MSAAGRARPPGGAGSRYSAGVMLLLLLACSSPLPVPTTTGAAAAPERAIPLREPVEAGVFPLVHDASVPRACDEAILRPQDGWDAGEPQPADAHAEVYGERPEPYHVHPQWTGDPSTSVTFVWRTDAETLSSAVSIGDVDGERYEVLGASFPLSGDAADGRVHEVRVCGLAPDHALRYRVGGSGAWSDWHDYASAPVRGSEARIRFGVGGDSRGGMTTLRAVLAGMSARGAQFVALTGDAVNQGSNVGEWNEWWDAGEGFVQERAVVTANGNHEGLASAFLALFALPGNERNFSVDYGNAHLVFLNDTPTSDSEMEEQSQWLEADLAATTQRWKLVFHHKPAYTTASHAPERDVLEWFVPVEEAGGVAMDFAGHNHNYERSVPIRDGKQVGASEGTTYVVSAGAGAGLYGTSREDPLVEVAVIEHHYVMVDIQGGQLTMVAYDLAGNVLDSVVLNR